MDVYTGVYVCIRTGTACVRTRTCMYVYAHMYMYAYTRI